MNLLARAYTANAIQSFSRQLYVDLYTGTQLYGGGPLAAGGLASGAPREPALASQPQSRAVYSVFDSSTKGFKDEIKQIYTASVASRAHVGVARAHDQHHMCYC